MGTTLYRYVLKEQLIPFTLAAFGMSFVLIAARLLQLARYLFNTSISFVDLLLLMLFILPKILIFTLPMAALMASVLAFVRMSGDNELTALHSAGVSIYQLLPALITMVTVVTCISYINTLMIVPKANRAFELKLKSLGKATVPLLMREGIFIDALPNLVFFFRSADASNMTIRGFFVEDQRHPQARATIVAEEASIFMDSDLDHLVFQIKNGIITHVPDDHKGAHAVSFKTYDLSLSLDELIGGSQEISHHRNNMTAMELWHQSKHEETSERRAASFRIEFHRRLALPFSCLILGLLGAPLGIASRHKSRMTGMALGVALFLGYYVMLTAGKGLAENFIIPPFVAAWGPNAVCALPAIVLWMRTHNPSDKGPGVIFLDHWRKFTFFTGKKSPK